MAYLVDYLISKDLLIPTILGIAVIAVFIWILMDDFLGSIVNGNDKMLKCKFDWVDKKNGSSCECAFGITLIAYYCDKSWKSGIRFKFDDCSSIDESNKNVFTKDLETCESLEEAKKTCELWFMREILSSIKNI
jgi:hypothetical protein